MNSSLITMPNAHFFLDYGSGTTLWMSGTSDQEIWGYAVDLEQVPASEPLRKELNRLVALYDTSLNWDSPSEPGPWREPECQSFNSAVRRAFRRLRDELGPDWQITDSFQEIHEDPDLDRYLADPQAFRR